MIDGSGNLYGTTQSGGLYFGTAFELSPPASQGERWSESVLWNFGNGNDGAAPAAPLLMDGSGNLYGTTAYGGTSGLGTVFELSPPSNDSGAWTESVLWNPPALVPPSTFGASPDGSFPSNLVMDRSGDLYGIAIEGGLPAHAGSPSGAGTVFELSPPATVGGTWTPSLLYTFSGGGDGGNPFDLIMDSRGNLIGAADSGGYYTGGAVFELTPSVSGGNWTESLLWSFGIAGDGNYPTGITLDSSGNFVGTTEFKKNPLTDSRRTNSGTIFETGPNPAPTPTLTPAKKPLLLSPSSLDLDKQVGYLGDYLGTIQVTNPNDVPVVITGMEIVPGEGGAGKFTFGDITGTVIMPGEAHKTSISIEFNPTSTGAKEHDSATLEITDTGGKASTEPQKVMLEGVGTLNDFSSSATHNARGSSFRAVNTPRAGRTSSRSATAAPARLM